ncbi:MAG: sensor histidine kinase [Anaerolineales bacterium]|nr:MAG: sensor histidine kinase [Anaerolineales bacterium]
MIKNTSDQKPSDLFSAPAASHASRLRDTRPFLVVVTFVLVGIYIVAISGSGPRLVPLQVSILTGLMVVHVALYWCLLILPEKISAYVVFLVVQSSLAFALTLFTRQATLSMGLYSPLVGLAVGVLRNRRWTALAILAILCTAGLSIYLLPESNIPTDYFWVMIPITLFVIIYVELYSRQIEAREESQKLLRELETAHAKLSEYAAQVEDLTLANERQRLARELHDTLAQGLVGLILQLEATATHLQNGHLERAEEIIRHAMSRARVTLADARRAIGDLREIQGSADDVGEMIRTEARRFSTATGIPCEINAVSGVKIPERVAEHCQRVVAEALINVTRYAQAQHTWISLSDGPDCLKISIRDDGIGFDPEKQTQSSGHYGLLGMRERARLAGGRLEIKSDQGIGTTITLTVPHIVQPEMEHQ